jgi:GNAT superfamily N-acetyltransferase
MEVRTAEVGDSGQIVRLLRQLGYDRDIVAVEDDIRSGAAGDVIVAATEDDIVGVLTMKIHRQFHLGAVVASIESLVVDQGERSRGIGAALVEAAVETARGSQCRLVELHSNHHRTQARRFYEREGFEITSNYFVRQL